MPGQRGDGLTVPECPQDRGLPEEEALSFPKDKSVICHREEGRKSLPGGGSSAAAAQQRADYQRWSFCIKLALGDCLCYHLRVLNLF